MRCDACVCTENERHWQQKQNIGRETGLNHMLGLYHKMRTPKVHMPKIRLQAFILHPTCPTNTSTFICAGVDFAAGLWLHHQPFVVQLYQSGIAQPALWRARRGPLIWACSVASQPADPISSGGTFVLNPEPDSKATSLSQVWLVMCNKVKGEGRASAQAVNPEKTVWKIPHK